MRSFFLSVLLLTATLLQAQPKVAASCRVQGYATNILQITYRPAGYARNEQVSDAVILKPPAAGAKPSFQWAGDTLVVNNGQVKLVGFQSGTDRGFRVLLQKDERIFGGGERALSLDRRNNRFNLYNNPWYGYGEDADNLNYSVPFVTSSRGYGLFFDNPSKGYLDIGLKKKDLLEWGATSGALTVYVILGDYPAILKSYHALTGRQPLPPRWALGNLMSRFGYTSEAQVKDIYGKMKAAGIPVDAVIFDLFWFGDSIKGTLGNLDWVNRSKWPDPAGMIRDFRKDGVRTVLVTEPFFVETSKNYLASRPYLAVDSSRKPFYLTDFYFGHGGLVDIFRKDAQQWFWQFYKRQMQQGVEGWWGDLGEPERHPAAMYHNLKDLGHARLFGADEVHNIYGHSWTKMLFNQYAKDYPQKRLFSLNRSGFAGTQRYSIFPWTGDVSRGWSGLRAQLPVLLGMSMSGVPYVHSDAGGFAGGEGDRELYTRWLQFAVFTPIFRPHGTALYEVDPQAFSFPSEAALMEEPYRSYAAQAIALRYALLPYNYSLAYRQATAGEPLMRPMYYMYPSDSRAAFLEDAYFWGPDLMVAPVVAKGADMRGVYFPNGTWYSLHTGEATQGPQVQRVSLPMDRIPVYVREGALLPLWAPAPTQPMRSTEDYRKNNRLVLRYFPSATKSSFTMYDDDGESKNAIASGSFELLTFTGVRKGGELEVTITTSRPERYRGGGRTIVVESPAALASPLKVTLNGKALNEDAAARMRVKSSYPYAPNRPYEGLQVAFDGRPVTLRFAIAE